MSGSAAPRVLIADDEASIALSLDFLMRAKGYATRIVSDGEAAMAAAREFAPDVLLLDVMLPKRSGYDVCKGLRACAWGRAIAIVLVTAKGGQHEVARGVAAGADAHLAKPFATQDIVALVDRLIAGRQTP
jgi:DNA-binding response OmpR family regulator